MAWNTHSNRLILRSSMKKREKTLSMKYDSWHR